MLLRQPQETFRVKLFSRINHFQHRLVKTPAAIGMRTPLHWQMRRSVFCISPFHLATGRAAIMRHRNAHIAYSRIILQTLKCNRSV